MKNKGLIILGVIVLVLFIIYMMVKGSYNTMVTQDEGVKSAWADVEAAYQRRSDLIPNLVSTVKGYANFEKETLTQVIEARSKATSVNIDANNLSPAAMQQFQSAQDGLSSALSRLLVTVERYPDLKANQNFMALQQELTNTENKIGFERKKFNKKVELFNGTIRKFPNVVLANMFGFSAKGYFKSEAGSEKAPDVNF
jgi:LemA protein